MGMRSSDNRLCNSFHVDPASSECAAAPPYDSSGGECRSAAECAYADGSLGTCKCKRWWDGFGAPGFCELLLPDLERPAYMEFRRLKNSGCHHNWPLDRCAVELDKENLLELVRREAQATADPTRQVPACAHDILPQLEVPSATVRVRWISLPLLFAISLLVVLPLASDHGQMDLVGKHLSCGKHKHSTRTDNLSKL